MYKWRVIVYLQDGRIFNGAVESEYSKPEDVGSVMFNGDSGEYQTMYSTDFKKLIGFSMYSVVGFEISELK